MSTRPDENEEVAQMNFLALFSDVQKLLGPEGNQIFLMLPIYTLRGPEEGPSAPYGFVVQLSFHAAEKWDSFMFEAAHEAVHLLDPTIGPASNLEEGIAVHYSLHVRPGMKSNISRSVAYSNAHNAVIAFGDVFTVAKKIREIDGTLNDAKAETLRTLCPDLDKDQIEFLLMRFKNER